MRFARVFLLAASVTAVGLGAPAARAAGPVPETDASRARCKASYERAQVLVREEHLQSARAHLLVCEESCPAELVQDCQKWFRDVEALTPTVRLTVTDSKGRALDGTKVTADGAPVTARDGLYGLDAGPHVFRVERDGFAPASARIELHAGERDRALGIVLVPAASPRPAEPAPAPSPVASYVVGGIGAAALVAAAVLGIKGQADRSSLRTSCAPTCDPSKRDSIATEWWVAAGLGIGGAVAVGAAVLLFPWNDRAGSAAVPVVGLSPRALSLTWSM